MTSVGGAPPGIDLARLAAYLPAVLDDYDPTAPLTAAPLAGGRSNITCLIAQPGRSWVLRRPPLGHVMPSAHDVAREYRSLSWLAQHGFPAPRPLALCEDHAVLGVSFLLMEYVAGSVIADQTSARSLVKSQADDLCRSMVHTLGQLHHVPAPPLRPGDSASSAHHLRRQLARWTQQWERTRTRQLPAVATLASWLRTAIDNLPSDHPITLVHGDYRMDNLILDPSTMDIRAVLDWEMSTAGDPLLDLAVLLVYWEQAGDAARARVNVSQGVTTGDGFWSRARLVEEYTRTGAVPTAHLDARLALACLKLAVIMESVHFRYLAGQATDGLSANLADAAPALLEMGLRVADGAGLDGLSA
ncbi:MAG: phosphotransferase [Micromonosporaceae bacterium]|nr:phosphotransferase [Micromonosporaceae bacterium]